MKKEEILAICLEEIRCGKSTVEDCIACHPEMEADLRSLLKIAVVLKPDAVQPSTEFKQRARRRIFKEMESTPKNSSYSWWNWHELTPARIIASVLVGVLILGAAGGSTAYAAQSSLPGDKLYPVKTTVENFQLAVTPGAVSKANLHMKLVQRRIDEAAQQLKQNRNVDAQALQTVEKQLDDVIKELKNSDDTEATSEVLSHLSAATLDQQLELERTLAGVPQQNQPALKQALSVARRGNLIAQVAYANRDFLGSQPSVSDKSLDEHQFKIDGTLLSITGRTWNLGGVIIQNVFLSETEPVIGSCVKIEGVIKSGRTFISKITVSEDSKQPTLVEGQFGGTNQNGTSNVGGISVEIGNKTTTQLQPGDKVQLKGDNGDGKLNVTNKVSKQDENKNTTKLSGILTAVDDNDGIITIKSAGSQMVINVSEAQIENERGRALNLSELDHMVGQSLKLEGLYKKGGLLFAHLVRIEVSAATAGPSGSSGKGQIPAFPNHNLRD
jgi:hypothetical protein